VVTTTAYQERKDTMALTKDDKIAIVKKFAQDENDTGSPEVQVALLTASIADLTEHLKQHKKDDHSRLGLLKQVAKRRRLLNFLKKISEERYQKLIKELKLSK
jgi:small subunit ribosomal protein S15